MFLSCPYGNLSQWLPPSKSATPGPGTGRPTQRRENAEVKILIFVGAVHSVSQIKRHQVEAAAVYCVNIRPGSTEYTRPR